MSHRVTDSITSATSAPDVTEVSDEDLLPLPTTTAPPILFMGQDSHGAPAVLGAAVSYKNTVFVEVFINFLRNHNLRKMQQLRSLPQRQLLLWLPCRRWMIQR